MSTQGGVNPNQRGQPSAQDTGTTAALDELARRLAEAARGLQQQLDPQQVLDRVVSLAVAMVPGAEQATITMVRARRHVYSAAATGELASWFDILQDETGEGPCLDAMWQQQTVRVNDLAADPRWPVLGPRAGERGWAACCACNCSFRRTRWARWICSPMRRRPSPTSPSTSGCCWPATPPSPSRAHRSWDTQPSPW